MTVIFFLYYEVIEMSKDTQAFILFNMLKAAGNKGVNKAQVAKALNVKETSVPVYFFGMKKLYNAEIEVIKNGRQVVAYKLTNPDKVTGVPKTRGAGKIKPKAVKKVAVKTAKPLTKSLDNSEFPVLDNEVKSFSDREFNDIKTSLGIL